MLITIINNDDLQIKVSKNFVLFNNTPDGKPLSEYIINITSEKINLYKSIFNLDKIGKITFEIFDNIEDWRKFYIERFNNLPPDYSRGYFSSSKNLSSCILHSDPMYNTDYWYKTLYSSSHEAFHILYKKYVYKEDRIVWFDEGMAQFLSGEKDKYLTNEKDFYNLFVDFKSNYIPIDNLNDRIQGNNSVSDRLIFKRENVFNGYTTSFLCIKYINDFYGYDYLLELMKDNKRILEFGENIIDDMINYYNKKFNNKIM